MCAVWAIVQVLPGGKDGILIEADILVYATQVLIAPSHTPNIRNHMELNHHLGKLSLASLFPDAGDLIFYLGDFLQITATFMVGNLGFEFVDLLLVLPKS